MAQVLVLGAGYGGVAASHAAARVGGRGLEVLLVDRRDHHLVRHETHRAIAAPDVADVLRVDGATAAGRGVEFRQVAVDGVDCENGRATMDDSGSIAFDALVLATGARTATYGVPGAAEHGLPMKDLEDAARIRRAVLGLCDRGGGHVVVCGGGLTGVQTAGEIAAVADDRDVDLDVRVVEALETVLPEESSALRSAVARRLRAAGIVVETGTPVVEVQADAVELSDGTCFETDVVVWAGGIEPAPPPVSPSGTVAADGLPVDPSLRVEGRDRVFAVGDAADVIDVAGRRAPATAWAARDEGKVAGRNAARLLAGDEPDERYRLDPPGTLVSVGPEAIAEVGGRVFGGRAARVLKRGAAVRHLRGVAGVGTSVRSAFKYL